MSSLLEAIAALMGESACRHDLTTALTYTSPVDLQFMSTRGQAYLKSMGVLENYQLLGVAYTGELSVAEKAIGRLCHGQMLKEHSEQIERDKETHKCLKIKHTGRLFVLSDSCYGDESDDEEGSETDE